MKRTALFILIGALLFAGCAKEEKTTGLPAEMAARALAKKAAKLDANGSYHESAKIYKEIVEKYPETKYYAELEKELLNKGISLKTPLVSRTSHIMFKFQKMVLKYKKERGFYPKAHALKVPKDLWGNPLVHYVPDRDDEATYEFLIFSKGPDRRAKTDDDIVLVYTKHTSDSTNKFGDTASKKELGVGRPGSRGSSDSVSLSELKKMTHKEPSVRTKGAKVSVDKIKAGTTTKKRKKPLARTETVKTLDQLLSE